MNITAFFKKNWIHFAAVGIFLVICLGYFRLQFNDYGLKQHDIEQFIGASHEITDFREHNNGQEPQWTNSMFGGMPATQISLIHSGNVFSTMTQGFFKIFPSPMGVVLLYMLGFYLMLAMMKVNNWLSIVGSLVYGFLSYQIIILQAGHNTKGIAIAFMAPVVGAFYMAYRRNWLWGALLSAIFMSFELASNHLQVTYYLGFVLLGLGIAEVVRVVKTKEFSKFLKATAGVVVGYGLALVINYGNIAMTNDYAKYSIRGGNDLTISPTGASNKDNSTEGLDRDYVTQYSYGIDETFSFITPYAKGAGTMAFGNSQFVDLIDESDLSPEQIATVKERGVAYWGDQPATSGPVYIGVIVVFLALLGLVYIKDSSKWALLAVTILTVMLSWGKNYMGLTNWFLDNVPGYDKFRAVTIILVIAELCIPLLAVLLVQKLIVEREEIKRNFKPFLITGAAYFVLLLGLKAGIDDSYTWIQEKSVNIDEELKKSGEQMTAQIAQMTPEQAQQNGIDKSNPQAVQALVDEQIRNQRMAYESNVAATKKIREEVYQSSVNRSLIFFVLAVGALAIYFFTSAPVVISLGALGLFAFLDVFTMTTSYLNSEELADGSGYKYWTPVLEARYPVMSDAADAKIMEMETEFSPELKRLVAKGRSEGKSKANELEAYGLDAKRIEDAYAFAALNRNSNYRVYDQQGGFSSAAASYYHKSLGGYHGAKLRSIQNLAEFHLYKSNNKVFDMMNVKYFLTPDQNGARTVNPNPTVLGNAWFVKKAKVVANPNEEILNLGTKFKMTNIGTGKFLVNGVQKSEVAAFGSEKLQYLLPGVPDTLNVPLSNGVPMGVEVVFVRDANGKTDLIMKQGFDADTSKSFTGMVAFKVISDFKPIEEVVVNAQEASKLKAKSWKGEGKITMRSYAPNKLVYHAKASDEGLAVFSEVYYPKGWSATVNGKPADIVKVNYLLRGLELPKGDSDIVFTYNDEKFAKLNTYSYIVSLLLIILTLGAGVMTIRNNKKIKVEA